MREYSRGAVVKSACRVRLLPSDRTLRVAVIAASGVVLSTVLAHSTDLDFSGTLRGSITDSPTLASDAQRQAAAEARVWAAKEAFLPTLGFLREIGRAHV